MSDKEYIEHGDVRHCPICRYRMHWHSDDGDYFLDCSRCGFQQGLMKVEDKQ